MNIYQADFVKPAEKQEIMNFLKGLRPIWEMRYAKHNPPPQGKTQRELLRPVYWLGNWQFACLNYYHPPKGIFHRCVEAEPYPRVLAKLVSQIEEKVHMKFHERDIPRGWGLNTCLINYYGERVDGDKAVDVARVGEHKDFEPGPVGSISFGERALIQFVDSPHRDAKSHVILQQWLEDCSLQIFGGDRFKKKLFHRVQRVEDKLNLDLPTQVANFRTRRINFTFRYVPFEHIKPFSELPAPQREDISAYVQQLAQHSEFWGEALQTDSRATEK